MWYIVGIDNQLLETSFLLQTRTSCRAVRASVKRAESVFAGCNDEVGKDCRSIVVPVAYGGVDSFNLVAHHHYKVEIALCLFRKR